MCCEEAVMAILCMSILLKYLAIRGVVFVGQYFTVYRGKDG